MANVTGKMYTKDGDIYYPRPYYRIGDILESTNPNNPANDGYIGTWELYGIGRTTVCIDINDNDFNTAGKQIGEKSHKLTTDEMPSHSHTVYIASVSGSNTKYVKVNLTGDCDDAPTLWRAGVTSDVGNNNEHNNIQPSIVVYRWRRIA